MPPHSRPEPGLRPPSAHDVPALARLREARRPGAAEALTWARSAVARTADLHDSYRVWVADHRGEAVAYAVAALFLPPPGSPANAAPEGYYLLGLMVAPAHRRRGLGDRLVRARLGWIEQRADRAWYFADDDNEVSVRLHAAAGFEPVTRDFWFPGLRHPDAAMTLYTVEFRPGDAR